MHDQINNRNKEVKMKIAQCCAFFSHSNGDDNDQFNERLDAIVKKCARKDLTIPTEDLNIIVRMDNTGYEYINEQHGLTERNE